jgi:hypothetical protein
MNAIDGLLRHQSLPLLPVQVQKAAYAFPAFEIPAGF